MLEDSDFYVLTFGRTYIRYIGESDGDAVTCITGPGIEHAQRYTKIKALSEVKRIKKDPRVDKPIRIWHVKIEELKS